MAERTEYAGKLISGLVEQFRGKKRIEDLMEVIGDELQEVKDFFDALGGHRTLTSAVGAQLDGVGDIVVLNRAEAADMAAIANPGVAMTDETYRRFLIYKVMRNTNICTYKDVIESFKVFWDKPLYYSEDPEEPATMIFETDVLEPGEAPENLLSAPIIKAAGVGVKVLATTETPLMENTVCVSGAMFEGVISTRLPEIQIDYGLKAAVPIVPAMWSVMQTTLSEIEAE